MLETGLGYSGVIWGTYIDFVEEIAAAVGGDDGVDVFENEQTWCLVPGHLEDIAYIPHLGR